MANHITLYGLVNCDKCRKARKWLTAQHLDFTFIDYRKNPIDGHVLLAWKEALGGWQVLINKRSSSWRKLDEGERYAQTDEDWLGLIDTTPTLIKRPILVTPHGLVCGYNEEAFIRILK